MSIFRQLPERSLRPVFALFVFGLGFTKVGAVTRVFESADGKELEAEVLSVTALEVELKRASDEQVFRLPLARLRQLDQDWLLAWKERQQADAPPPTVPHPLGWTRLSLHAPKENCSFAFEGVSSAGTFRSAFKRLDNYLPKGAWLWVRGEDSGSQNSALARYDGASDWLLTPEADCLRLRSGLSDESRVIGFKWRPEFGKDEKIVQFQQWMEQGATVEIRSHYLESDSWANAKPSSMILDVVGEQIDWASLPESLVALKVDAHQFNLDLEGLEKLTSLEYLQVRCVQLQGLATLANLPQLQAVSLCSKLKEEEIAELANVKNLRFLGLDEETEGRFPKEVFDSFAKLTKLEAVNMGVNGDKVKYLRPGIAFGNCRNLTSLRLSRKFYQEGEFLRKFPKLTTLNLQSERVAPELIEELMAKGHFENLRELTLSNAFPIGDLPYLQELSLNFQTDSSFNSIGSLPALHTLTLYRAGEKEVKELIAEPELSKVSILHLHLKEDCDLDLLKSLPHLKELRLSAYPNETLDLRNLGSLQSLVVSYSPKVVSLQAPGQLLKLTVNRMDQLDLKDSNPLPFLQSLRIGFGENLTSLEGLGPCPELKDFFVSWCPELDNLNGLEKNHSLKTLKIYKCGDRTNVSR